MTDPFRRNRKNPVDGVVRHHNGVDYRAARGTPVLAAANGRVEKSYTSKTYGEVIVIRHDDGSATLYAHLEKRLVEEGDGEVKKGQQIGTADSTGRSKGDHLHFEYVPNGEIIRSPNRIDPHPCVGDNVSGSIRLSDNGSLVDDAFRAAVDGFVIGETAIGAANVLAVNNLVPGQHQLTVTAIVAPDGIGTLQIDLFNGWTFLDGRTSLSDGLLPGESRTYTFLVPQVSTPPTLELL